MISWQEKLISDRDKLSHIFSSGDMSDVTFVVGEPPEEKRFTRDKLILSLSSDVFFTMFYGSLPEMGEVNVPDIQPDIFEITMKYVFENTLSVQSVEQAMYTYCASEKYNIPHLRDLCAAYISDNLIPENLPFLFKIPAILENLQIKSEYKNMLSENTSDILTSGNFAKVPLVMVKDIVQLEHMDVRSEENLFELVLEWAKSFCPKEDTAYTTEALRAVMDDFLPHIRFLAMSTDTFHLGPVSSGVLTDSEIVSISQNIVAPGRRELPVWCNKGMSRNITRVFPLKENHDCWNREQLRESIEGFITIRSGNILFKGVTVYVKSDSYPSNVSLKINIVNSRNLAIQEEIATETIYSFNAKKSLLKCRLRKPFPLRLETVYQIFVCSNYSIFSQCKLSQHETEVIKNQDFEMEYRLAACENLFEITLYYPHFCEILYSKF